MRYLSYAIASYQVRLISYDTNFADFFARQMLQAGKPVQSTTLPLRELL
jgi:hypothetical protein